MCKRATNNKHFDCPARMADGRLFTDYRPRGSVNFKFANDGSGKQLDSYKYRQYLMQNADRIMRDMRKQAYEKAVCGPCDDDAEEDGERAGTMMPARVVQKCDGKVCTFMEGHPMGVGIGRAYGTSGVRHPDDQFSSSASAAHVKKQKKKCDDFYCVPLPEDVAYDPKDDEDLVHDGDVAGRLTIPYGGFSLMGGDADMRQRVERDLKRFRAMEERQKGDELFV